MTGHSVSFGDGAEVICRSGEAVLSALERGGFARVPVGCRGGGCGVCKVRVIEGRYTTGRMSRAHVSEDAEKQGYALACRLYPQGPLVLETIGKCVRIIGPDTTRRS